MYASLLPISSKTFDKFPLNQTYVFSDLTLKCFFHSLILFSAPQVKYIVIPLYYNVYLTFYKFSNIYYTYFSVRLFLHFFPSLPIFFFSIKNISSAVIYVNRFCCPLLIHWLHDFISIPLYGNLLLSLNIFEIYFVFNSKFILTHYLE